MSVQSTTFDLLFDQLKGKEKRLTVLNRNYARAERRLEALLEKPENAARQARIDGILDTQVWRIKRIAEVEDTITGIKETLPKDEFTPEFWVNDAGENWGVSVTVTDSPYDDTYVGGTPIAISINGRYCETGNSGFRHTRGNWNGVIDDTQTIGFSSNKLTGDYSTTVSLLNADTRESFYSQELINSDGVQLI